MTAESMRCSEKDRIECLNVRVNLCDLRRKEEASTVRRTRGRAALQVLSY